MADAQEVADKFYWSNGPCCAGCDHWGGFNSLVGECNLSPPVSGAERFAGLGMENVSSVLPAGFALTKRGDKCGRFKDEFDWFSLPLTYLTKIGHPTPSNSR